jgi:hypothetical protein
MSRIITTLLTSLMLLAPVTMAETQSDAQQFICDPINYPNGTIGVAEVRVHDMGSSMDVVVDYYDAARVNYLGRYQEIGSEEAPSTHSAAHDFAFNNFYHKQ